MRISLSALIAALAMTASIKADDATDFALFWGTVLAIEDHCPDYYSRTDATTGGHLSGADYKWAQENVERLRASVVKTVETLGCLKSAEEAAKIMGYSFFSVWEIQ